MSLIEEDVNPKLFEKVIVLRKHISITCEIGGAEGGFVGPVLMPPGIFNVSISLWLYIKKGIKKKTKKDFFIIANLQKKYN